MQVAGNNTRLPNTAFGALFKDADWTFGLGLLLLPYSLILPVINSLTCKTFWFILTLDMRGSGSVRYLVIGFNSFLFLFTTFLDPSTMYLSWSNGKTSISLTSEIPSFWFSSQLAVFNWLTGYIHELDVSSWLVHIFITVSHLLAVHTSFIWSTKSMYPNEILFIQIERGFLGLVCTNESPGNMCPMKK